MKVWYTDSRTYYIWPVLLAQMEPFTVDQQTACPPDVRPPPRCNPSRNTNFTYTDKSTYTKVLLITDNCTFYPQFSTSFFRNTVKNMRNFRRTSLIFIQTQEWPCSGEDSPLREKQSTSDPAISGFAGQSGDMLMGDRRKRGYRPLRPTRLSNFWW